MEVKQNATKDKKKLNNSKNYRINPNLSHLIRQRNISDGSVLEGSSRSGKTWSSIDFIIYLCSKIEHNCTINIVKETFNSFKTTLHDDFNRRLPMFGVYSPFADRQEVQSFKIFGNKINLMGADKPSKFEGASCDYFWINEALDVQQDIFDALEQRCRKFWWMDYNPKFVDHWVYNSILRREDVSFLKTVFSDNPGISKQEKKKILSYEPTEFNINQGTANDYKWQVYGLGNRAAPEGLIFPDVTWINQFPQDIERIYYGLDFGYTNNPSALIRTGIEGTNLFIEYLYYQPTENANVLIPVLRELANDQTIWADSADPGMIMSLRNAGLRVVAVKKFHGSIEYGIDLIKRFKIHIVDSLAARKEQSGYRYKEINGIKLNIPEEGSDHGWDAVRYALMHTVRKV